MFEEEGVYLSKWDDLERVPDEVIFTFFDEKKQGEFLQEVVKLWPQKTYVYSPTKTKISEGLREALKNRVGYLPYEIE